jgi:hypothetical protein
MSSVDRGRCLVLTTIVITLLGNLLFVVLPAASDSIPFFAGTILAFCAVTDTESERFYLSTLNHKPAEPTQRPSRAI